MRRVSTSGLLQAAGVLTIVLSLLTLLPSNYHAIQLFSHFRLQYFAVASLLVVAYIVLRNRRYAVLMFATAFINGVHVLPWYLDEPYATGDRDLSLLLANLLYTNEEYDKLFALLDNEQPEVVVLQEVTHAWAAELKRLEGKYPHQVIEARDGKFGIALLAKYPLTTVATVASEPLGFPTIVASLAVSGRGLQVVATHPMVPLGTRNYAARNTQLATIGEMLRRSEGARVLVGDLNTSMWELKYRVLEARTGLRNVRRGFGITPTWPTFLPLAMIPIDHALVSGEIGVRDVRTGARIGSDHLPLIVTIRL
jgi:endonuclease/exonuclease/phosphatase (EEP) superfamily protein YafD